MTMCVPMVEQVAEDHWSQLMEDRSAVRFAPQSIKGVVDMVTQHAAKTVQNAKALESGLHAYGTRIGLPI